MSRSQIRRGGAGGGPGAGLGGGPGAGPGGLGGDDTGCPILHVDMDAFYASVELIDRPHLRGRPVIVGGSGRGVVLSATYEARAQGVHSAMPMARARRLSPEAIVIEPDHRRYAEVSDGVMAIFASITPLVEPLSLDEAFLDVSGARRRLGAPTRIAELIRARVHDEQGITCSVGVASTKFVAKLASTRSKPDGLLVVPRDRVVSFLHPLPVGALWGVGERTEERLLSLGLRTVGDIAHTPVETLTRALGTAAGTRLLDLSWGRDDRAVVPGVAEKSIGAEETFARDVDDPETVLREVLRLAERVAGRARRQGVRARTVALKIRFADFRTITRSRTLPHPVDTGHDVFAAARDLHAALGLERPRIRLVGVRLEGLVADSDEEIPEQLDLLGDLPAGRGDEGWRSRGRGTRERGAAERAADRLRERFGEAIVRPARLVAEPGGDPAEGSADPP